ncbi:Fe-dependent oxidoreductase, alcohol dehydrogenase [Desulfosporosinus orientis DSM 765]|uniref:Fe-dependent oxidoreductase, alcohol dehydrogenase n=1 Tax=Desulfosporosinus orientis (strain ATCC 19365 / DSM 765 / NCIMB 8382 / VKM B-1628 / Singapore I) TaxID=768706 RepID=G7W6C5_DESOD|nr:iron-containing alcohol dehydrogenase [Desulfosporosinus orientis]AET68132.1 Fe-dependent oxidoreductase, alcohol dehydrogenase [Desulfosporosinus orientis DSM 765]
MNLDFIYKNPTTIYFGRDALNNLRTELGNYGDTVMLAYGKGSIKNMGLYDQVVSILKECGKNIVELTGIMPNPTYEKVTEGAKLVRENDVDLILAVGGGSVIDCAKGISVSAYCEGDPWTKYWLQFQPVDNKIVPVASILTLAGTGSEMNGGSVITNDDMKLKMGRVFPAEMNPKFSILNPEYTFSLPTYQLVSGIFDMMSHLMESYFSGEDDVTTDYLIEGLLRSIIHSAKIAVKDPKDYEARSNLMWSSTLAMNPIMGLSKPQDWQVHMIEHQLGAYTDCAHGMGLAAVSLPYYRAIYKNGLDKFVRFATQVWGIEERDKPKEEIALAGIDALEAFVKECGIVINLKELGATEEMLPLVANSTVILGGYKKLTHEEILDILKSAYAAE